MKEREGKVIVYNDLVMFYPVTEAVRNALTINMRTIEYGEMEEKPFYPWQEMIKCDGVWKKIDYRSSDNAYGCTYPGFSEKIIRTYKHAGWNIQVQDKRTIIPSAEFGFPEPRLELMYGFRYSQAELVTKALLEHSSGLIGAPTRFGKTACLINIIRAYPTLSVCVVAPGVDLVNQLYSDITDKFGLPGRRVSLVCGRHKLKGSIEPGDVVVCSADSLKNIDTTQFQLLLADEPHELVTDSRRDVVNSFPHARRIGFGATLTGRFDGRDELITGLFGPVLAERTYLEAVEEGAICPLTVIFWDVTLEYRRYWNRQRAYEDKFFQNPNMHQMIADICHKVIPEEFQTLIFIKHEKQAEALSEYIGRDTCIAMAKRMSEKERKEITAKLKNDEIKRCLCSRIYIKGVTFSDVRVLINAEAGGNNTSSIQKPGRLAEKRPGKKCGIIIDFSFRCDPAFYNDAYAGPWKSLIWESKAREKAYREKGYDIYHVNSLEELKIKFNELI